MKENAQEDLVYQNQILQSFVNTDKVRKIEKDEITVDLSYFRKMSELYTEGIVVDLNDMQIIGASSILAEFFDEELILRFADRPFENLYSIELFDEHYYAYNDVVVIDKDGKVFNLLTVTYIANNDVKRITNRLNQSGFLVLLAIAALSLLVSRFSDNLITKPMTQILDALKRYGVKNFTIPLEIESGDEFEELSSSMNEMAEKLMMLDEEQKLFYESVSHELKTPLTIISGYAEGLKAGVIEENQAIYDAMISESRKVKKTLEDMIYLGRLDSITETSFTNGSLNQVIGKVLNDVLPLASLNDVEIEFEPTFDLQTRLSKKSVYKMFHNILTNCIRHAKSSVFIEVNRIGVGYEILVSDDGDGFREDILEDILKGIYGKGLGLLIVTKIVEQHHWKLKLYNNQGAVYKLTVDTNMPHLLHK